PGTIQFLMSRYILTKNHKIGSFIKETLFRMAKGGIYDQLLGGFHRYSVDASWIIPHFEKMADDNAWLLRNYLQAYEIFREGYFKETAEGIIRFFYDTLTAPDGGFYASQDADITPNDEGSYFTWTDDDLRSILTPDEYNVSKMHYFDKNGSMPHDPSKKVLFIAKDLAEIAMVTKIDIGKVKELILSSKSKLLRERKNRKAPFVDKTLYTSINGMAITSFIKAFRSLGYSNLKEFSLKSLDRILSLNFVDNILYRSEGTKAILDDYIYLIEACLAAYEVTAAEDYLKKAIQLMSICIDRLWDRDFGGFFDTEDDIMGINLKIIEDTPHPSANSIAIELLMKLSFLTNEESYFHMAEKCLKVFYSRAKDIHIHAGSYFNAMDGYFNPLKLEIYSNKDSALFRKALRNFYPHLYLSHKENKGFVIPCFKNTCYEPIKSSEEFDSFINNLFKF
ncbi:MAG: hypothetical protein N2511_07655, partial [Thermodesulfovibrionales bacterium]|nr:hypothetical protein [Thermodesulfovibrionales bacterium]